VSGGDLRLGLMTFKDYVNVVHKLTANVPLVQAIIGAISASGGANSPEASDIAKENSINNLNGFDEPWSIRVT
jgi:CRISPR-associated Cas5-like protein